MLKMVDLNNFWDRIFMNGVAIKPFELKLARVALTRRGGCDAEGPGCDRDPMLRDRGFVKMGPGGGSLWNNLGS